MSKESALRLATGNPTATPNPSLVTSNPPAVQPAGDAIVTTSTEPVEPAKNEQLSIFIKKEAEIFKARELLKKQQADFAEKEKQYNEVLRRATEFEELSKKDKAAALKSLGWSDTDIVNLMNPENATPDPVAEARKIAQEEANKLRSELTEKEQKAIQARDAQLVTNFKNELSQTLKKDASKYKFAAHRGKEAELQAIAIIEQNLIATNGEELISIEEALQITDDLYKQDYESGRKLFEEATPPETTTTQTARGAQAGKPPISQTPQSKPRTLTNAVSATSASAPVTIRETREQKKERLANAIRTHGLRK